MKTFRHSTIGIASALRALLLCLPLVGLIGLIGLALPAVAGPGHWKGMRGPPSPEAILEHLTEELDLTAEQQESVLEILREKHELRLQIQEEMQERIRSLREETDLDLEEVLSADQMSDLRALREEAFNRRGPGHGPGPGPGPRPGQDHSGCCCEEE